MSQRETSQADEPTAPIPPAVEPQVGPPGVPPPPTTHQQPVPDLDPAPPIAPEARLLGTPMPPVGPERHQRLGTKPEPWYHDPPDEPGSRIHFGLHPGYKAIASLVVMLILIVSLVAYQVPVLSLGTGLVLLILIFATAANTTLERRSLAEAIFLSGVPGFQRVINFPLDHRTVLDVRLVEDICELHVHRGDGFDKRLLTANRPEPVVAFAVRAAGALGIQVRIDPRLGPADLAG